MQKCVRGIFFVFFLFTAIIRASPLPSVDMIATGTDVKAIECLVCLRNVKSRNYFEQMQGRGTRTLTAHDLQQVSPFATAEKQRFLIVDAGKEEPGEGAEYI